MLRRVLGALAAASAVLVSWVAASQPGLPGAAEGTRAGPGLLATAFRTGIAPAPAGSAGHYVVQHRRASAFFTDKGMDMRLPSRGARARELGWSVAGARAVKPQADKPREAKLNRMVGPREAWELDVPTYGGLRYPGVLPGVDLWFEERAEGLEYGLRAERGEALRRVRLEYAGAREVRVVEAGRALEVDLGEGVLREQGLHCWQEAADGSRREVGCRFADARWVGRERWEYAIAVDVEDSTLPVVVDPVIAWSTYLGTEEGDEFGDLARGDAGELFITGTLRAASFSEVPQQGLPAGTSVLVARLSEDGGFGAWTLFGGEADEQGSAIALGDKKLYVAGITTSGAFGIPVNHGAGGTKDGFVAQLDPGTLKVEWIYLVGTAQGDDIIHDLSMSPDGGLFIAGTTSSPNFPMERSPSPNAGWDAFITRLSPGTDAGADAATVDWSTVFRGSNDDLAYAVTVSESGGVYATGRTESLNLFGSPQRPHAGPDGGAEVFVVKLNQDTGLGELSTYLGGKGNDEGRALVLPPVSTTLLVGGTTGSLDVPDAGSGASATSKAFVSSLNRDSFAHLGTSVVGGTNGNDEGRALTLSKGNIYLGGIARSSDFPVDGGFDTTFGAGTREGFVARVGIGSNVPQWSSFVGGSQEDEVLALQGDSLGRLYIGGNTSSADLVPADVGGFNTSYTASVDGGFDLFVMQVDPNINPPDAGGGSDGGEGGPDGGTGGTDGGTGGTDGGPGGTDGGTGAPDAGQGEERSPVGWSCGTSGGPGALGLVSLAGLVLLVSRRRTGASPRV